VRSGAISASLERMRRGLVDAGGPRRVEDSI
jgi:hypothetical protein